MSDVLLDMRGIVVRYGEVVALGGVTIGVRAGEAVAIVGANGAGKSSLLNAVIGRVRTASGMIRFAGAPIERLPPWARARRGIGYSPEGRRIFPAMTVRENLEVGGRDDASAIASRVEEIYGLFPTLRRFEQSRGWQLSGGQQQMLAIGRALMARPRLLLLDEPSQGLSPAVAADVFACIRAIADGGGAVLFADQNVAAALAVADRGFVLRTGHIVAQGSAADLRQRDLAGALLGG